VLLPVVGFSVEWSMVVNYGPPWESEEWILIVEKY
jgi:hypothetical protein